MEFDEENSMYYFHARYYNPPTFISRDPLFEAKPWMSAYAYCRNNPLIFIDPNGEDEYEFDKKGKLINVIENKNADILRIVKTDRKGNIKYDKNGNTKTIATSQNYAYGTVDGTSTNALSTELDIKDNNSRETMFEFLANNTNVEWATFNGCLNGETDGGEEINKIGTNHDRGRTNSLQSYIDYILNGGGVINEYTHSHPSGSLPFPSGYSQAPWVIPSYGGGDHGVATKYNNSIRSMRVYDVDSKSYYEFWRGGYNRMKK
jgi:RHS repeat-associated protein